LVQYGRPREPHRALLLPQLILPPRCFCPKEPRRALLPRMTPSSLLSSEGATQGTPPSDDPLILSLRRVGRLRRTVVTFLFLDNMAAEDDNALYCLGVRVTPALGACSYCTQFSSVLGPCRIPHPHHCCSPSCRSCSHPSHSRCILHPVDQNQNHNGLLGADCCAIQDPACTCEEKVLDSGFTTKSYHTCDMA